MKKQKRRLLLSKFTESGREKIRLARDIFCEVFNVSPNCMRHSKVRKCSRCKKALSYFYYHEMGLSLHEVGEAIGVHFTTIHYHITGAGRHSKYYIANTDYRDLYLEARYKYYKTITERIERDVSANRSTDGEA